MLSNYLLFTIFIGMTVFYIYYCFIYEHEREPCYANHYSPVPVNVGEGRDITSRFYDILLLGSVCGIVELTRNAFHLYMKFKKQRKMQLVFSLMGFVTAFLFLLNFILMMLWRYGWEGNVCSGDFLSAEERKAELANPSRKYLLVKGNFIRYLIRTIWGMFGIVTLSILCIALTLTYRGGYKRGLS